MIKINKIQLQNFRFFIDEEVHNSFELNGQDTLIYGENGSGKSSLFKAFEFLTQPTISENEFDDNINIFRTDDTYLKFDFDNGEELQIDRDHLSLGNDFPFVEKLSVSKPLLDYKHLLNVSYAQTSQVEEKNLFTFFKKILEEYPIDEEGKRLKELEDEEHFEHFEKIIQEELFDDINIFLEKFQQNFKITSISLSGIGKKAYLKIEYFNKDISAYKFHLFLNESRLSALAISVYFAIIKKQFHLLGDDSLKILVLDDLLISLDMSNRLNLIDILKSEFSDFQIFFFTHDKAFFEVLKDKMNWKAYEIYVDDIEDYEKPFIKTNKEYSEKVKEHFDNRDYPASSNYLRKELERLFYDKLGLDNLERIIDLAKRKDNYHKLETCFPILIGALKAFDNCEHIPEHKKAEKCKEFSDVVLNAVEAVQSITNEDSFHDINGIKDRILNPQSHNDLETPLYKKELEDAIKLVEAFDSILDGA
jgi:ABC-type multidrug transport system ATPase subunit